MGAAASRSGQRGGSRSAKERCGFGSGKESVLAAGERAESERAIGYAQQPSDLISEGLEHQADLTLHSLMEHDANAPGAKELEGVDARQSPFETTSTKERGDFCSIEGTAALHLIDFGNLMARMGQPLDQDTIVCEKQKPFAVSIKTPDIAEISPARGQKVVNGLPSPRIYRGAEESPWLVEQNGQRGSRAYGAAVEGNDILLCDSDGETILDKAVDGHPTVEDELFYPSPGSEAATA